MPDDPEKIKLTSKDRYIFSSCARHADMLGLLMGIPSCLLVTTILRRGRLRDKPPIAYVKYQIAAVVVSYACFAPSYMGTTCWNYMDLLPEDSELKKTMLRSYDESSSHGIFTKTRIIISTFRNKVCEEAPPSITGDEKHEIQSKLRWVSEVESRPQTMLGNMVTQYVDVDKLKASVTERHLWTMEDFAAKNREQHDKELVER